MFFRSESAVTTPVPPRDPEQRIPFRRIVLWTVIALLLLLGLVLYVLYGSVVTPVLAPEAQA